MSEEKEKRVTKKLSRDFNRKESQFLGALSQLDDVLLNLQVRVHSGTTLWSSRNSNGIDREQNKGRSQIDPHLEVRTSPICLLKVRTQKRHHRTFTSPNDTVQSSDAFLMLVLFRETLSLLFHFLLPHIWCYIYIETQLFLRKIPYLLHILACIWCSKFGPRRGTVHGGRISRRNSMVPLWDFFRQAKAGMFLKWATTPHWKHIAILAADRIPLALQQFSIKSKSTTFNTFFNRSSILPKSLTTTSHFWQKTWESWTDWRLFPTSLQIHKQVIKDDKRIHSPSMMRFDAVQMFPTKEHLRDDIGSSWRRREAPNKGHLKKLQKLPLNLTNQK